MIRFVRVLSCAVLLLSGSFLSHARIKPSYYTPDYSEFFREAVKEKGLVVAILATSDRIVKDSRITAMTSYFSSADGLIHEDINGPVIAPYPEKFFDIVSAVPSGKPRQFAGEESFIEYLIGNNMASDAVYYLFGNPFAESDALSYYKGLSLYSAGGLTPAGKYFAGVPAESAYREKAVFYGTVCDVYTGKYDGARELLDSYAGPKQELKHYELAAISLLQDDCAAYKEHAEHFTYSSYALGEGEKLFDTIYRERYETPRKSPWLAAGMSAVVPGLGKIYSGCYGEGATSFLLIGSFGYFAVENWVRNGPGDWRTVLFTTLSSLMYLGNIYGSYVSVGLYYDYLNNAQNQTIVFNVHLPVRSLFK